MRLTTSPRTHRLLVLDINLKVGRKHCVVGVVLALAFPRKNKYHEEYTLFSEIFRSTKHSKNFLRLPLRPRALHLKTGAWALVMMSNFPKWSLSHQNSHTTGLCQNDMIRLLSWWKITILLASKGSVNGFVSRRSSSSSQFLPKKK